MKQTDIIKCIEENFKLFKNSCPKTDMKIGAIKKKYIQTLKRILKTQTHDC